MTNRSSRVNTDAIFAMTGGEMSQVTLNCHELSELDITELDRTPGYRSSAPSAKKKRLDRSNLQFIQLRIKSYQARVSGQYPKPFTNCLRKASISSRSG